MKVTVKRDAPPCVSGFALRRSRPSVAAIDKR
jgi:hypothetical protein